VIARARARAATRGREGESAREKRRDE